MGTYVLHFSRIDRAHVGSAGGKGAHLGELSRIGGVRVPPGFCVTTAAFQRTVADAPAVRRQLDRLSRLAPDETAAIRASSAELRETIEQIPVPADVETAIEDAVARLGHDIMYAVRSSATAEDLPAASFAGQHDSYLNVLGIAAVLQRVSRCWASLFTERAVIYRVRNRIDHRQVRMAVVVQQMVFPQAAGILFTADPVTDDRNVAAVEAVAGLAEALVSGVTNADGYKVRNGRVIVRSIAPNGPALADTEVVRLTDLGRLIEAHFGRPQDIEWCLAHDGFHIVQSRPITTLFPIPETNDGRNHVYLSVGHQQMMTDPLKPLGISFWQMTTPRPMAVAGGRLFVDVTTTVASRASRDALFELMERSDPLMCDALRTVIDRAGFVPRLPDDSAAVPPPAVSTTPLEADPAIVEGLIKGAEASIAALKRDIRSTSGAALFEFIRTDLQELKRLLFDRRGHQVFMTAIEATWWLNEHLERWLGEKNAADTLTLSVPNNITSQMGLALLDVADVIRRHPAVVAFLEHVEGDAFLDELPKVAGGHEARGAIRAWLDRFGMRGAGEIDITRPRWSECPRTLLPLLLANVRNFEPGEARRRFERGWHDARRKEQDVLTRLRALPDGEQKAEETKRMIDRVRTFIGYREYPKYGMVSRYFVYKQALLEEAERLVRAHVLRDVEDIFYLTFDELHAVVQTHRVNDRLVRERKDAFASYRSLTPPRVLTSDGEALTGSYRRGAVPGSALVGLPVSAGVVEGRARIVLDMADATVEPGDILVTAYTDPSWTPLFIAIAGLVTEVGGLMTHGAVIAREYGLPAVVGVEHATRLIRDGQRIRLHGTDGYVEIVA